MKLLFWISLSLIIYCYFLYPVLIFWVSKLFSRPVKKQTITPFVSIIISVCNEEDVLEGKIKNLFSLNYPQDKLEILIGSDGSEDRTNEILQQFRDPRLQVIVCNQRQGKPSMLALLVPRARGKIIVFNDARQHLAPDAIQELMNNFADPTIGCVSGELVFLKSDGLTAQGVSLYWKYEKLIRYFESQTHSMLGATGAIYAIRKELYDPVPQQVILDDMYTPLKIIQKGYRAIFDKKVLAFDRAAENAKEEYVRKTRTLAGNYQIFGLFLQLFNPFLSPIAIQFFSHKLLRVLVPFLMLIVFLINVLLSQEAFYFNLIVVQIVFYMMAIIGSLLVNKTYAILMPIYRLCYVPYIFCLLNISAVVGLWRFIFLKQTVTWQKARKSIE